MTLAELSYYLFAAFNSLRVVSYLPQIYVVARDANGASAISYSTWTLWIAANASTGFYAFASLADSTLAAISMFNAACCTVVVGLTVFKRYRFSRSMAKRDEFPLKVRNV